MLTSGTFSPNSPVGNRTRIHTDRMAPFLFVWDRSELENDVNQPNVPILYTYILHSMAYLNNLLLCGDSQQEVVSHHRIKKEQSIA